MAVAASLDSVVQVLNQYLVPAEETECGEYLYRMPLKLTEYVSKKSSKKYRYETGEYLANVISALLNTSGGVIQLHPCIPQVHFREKEFEEWRNKFDDKLNFISGDVFHRCVSLKWNKKDGLIYILIHKSYDLVTANAHLYTRDLAKNKQVTDFKFITHVMNQRTSQDCRLPLTEPFKYGDTCTNMETESLEFKHYDTPANTVEQLIERLNNERFKKALYGMANLPGGGNIVLGVKEDSSTKENRYIGQVLEKSQEDEFKKRFQELLEQNADGRSSIWGKETNVPKEGTNWSCKFIPLQMPTTPRPPPRRVLIHIHMFHCPGGAFLKKPKAFTINDDGEIEELTFDEWATRHRTITSVSAIHGTSESQSSSATPAVETSSGTRERIAASHMPADIPQTSETPTKVTPRLVFQDNSSFSYANHSSSWQQRAELKQRPDIVQHPEVPDIFGIGSPLSYQPRRDVLQNILAKHSLPDLLRDFDQVVGSPGFGIAADSQFNCIRHSCTALPQVPNHIMDLLTVTDHAVLSTKAVCKRIETPEIVKSYNAYTVVLARILKKRMLEVMHVDGQYPKMGVQIFLQNADGTPKVTPQIYREMFSDVETSASFRNICLALSNTLKNMNTCFRNLIVRDEDLLLSVEQSRLLLDLDTNRFNLIEGPPGCGKTLLAQRYGQTKGKDISYIASSNALVKRAKAKGIDAHFAADSEEVLNLLTVEVSQTRHIIIDDNHNFAYTEHQMHKICKSIAATDRYLHVFQDSLYHNYLLKIYPKAFGVFLYSHGDKYGMPHLKCLNQIHRNTQVVGSFLMEQVADLLPENTKAAVRNESSVNGDDVAIQQMKNLRANGPENGLIGHIKSLLASSVDPRGKHYTTQDVTILVDNKNPDEALKEKLFFQTLFREHSQVEVHGADEYPTKGITIDCVDSYIGLECRVVIFVMPKEPRFGQDDKVAYTKYKIAIASRGIDRVDFLQEHNLDGITALDMKIDRCPIVGASKAPLRVWIHYEAQPVRDVCWVSEEEGSALFYTTESSVKRMSVTGEPRPLTLDTSHTGPLSVTCSIDGEWSVVASCVAGGTWSVYYRQSSSVYRHHVTHTVDDHLCSVRATPEGRLAVLLHKNRKSYLRLYGGVSSPDLVWKEPVPQSISASDPMWIPTQGAMSLSADGNLLVCGPQGVAEYRPTGDNRTKAFNYPTGQWIPSAVCMDTHGLLWVGCRDGSVWTYGATKGRRIIETGGGQVNSLALNGNNLVVGTMSGLQLYDVET